jgi:hypothetical protein
MTPEQIVALAKADGSFDCEDEDDPAWCSSVDMDVDVSNAPGTGVAEVWDAGFIHNVAGEPGYGFASGGLLDRMLPGRELAAFTGTALGDGLERLSDCELIGFLCAARRNTSWQQAAQLAAVTDLEQRRAGADGAPGEHVADEVAAALTLTPRAAEGLLALAAGVTRLSQVPAALAAGVIDMSRAEVFARELMPLGDELAVRAEAIVMPRAPGLTTGQLAYALQRAVAAVDPAAAERRKKRAEQDARVEVWMEPGRGTAAVAGRDLPAAAVIAADKRLTAAARWLKARGAGGTMDWLRSRAYLAFINGYRLDGLLAGLLASEAADHGQAAGSSGDFDSSDDAAGASGTPTTGNPAAQAAGHGDSHDTGPADGTGPGRPCQPCRSTRPGRAGRDGQPDHARADVARPVRRARRSRRVRRPGRRDLPRPDHRARRQPGHPLVRDPGQPRRQADRPRLRPRRPRPAGQRRPGGLASHREDHPDRSWRLRAPAGIGRLPALQHPAARDQDPQPALRVPRLPTAGGRLRRRPHHPLRQGRPHLRV